MRKVEGRAVSVLGASRPAFVFPCSDAFADSAEWGRGDEETRGAKAMVDAIDRVLKALDYESPWSSRRREGAETSDGEVAAEVLERA